jgi:signal transduction histidine kinase
MMRSCASSPAAQQAYASNSAISFCLDGRHLAGSDRRRHRCSCATRSARSWRWPDAAEDFGKGREIDFGRAGAREVRQAGIAFIDMKRRIERAIEQRTTMLNGVSHDLRTVLTRFKLSLALIGESAGAPTISRSDVVEMQRMLEAYLAFARGDGGEAAAPPSTCAPLLE